MILKKLLPFIFAITIFLSGCSYSGLQNYTSQTDTEASIPESVNSDSEITALPSENIKKENETVSADTPETITNSDNKLISHIIDVGQGDSIFIELPDSDKCILIDAGEYDKAQTIITYIHNLGYDTLDYVVATHPHSDHIGGLPEVIDNFNVKTIYLSPESSTTKTYEKLLNSVKSSKANVITGKSGVSILKTKDVDINIVAPIETKFDNLNNASIVIKLTYKNNSFLFTGDAEKDEENTITANIDADILKVGHHGSSSSTSQNFIDRVTPTYAVISCGLNNDYGHPHKETLDILSQNKISTYRTDLSGTIIFTSDGNNISVNAKPSENIVPATTTTKIAETSATTQVPSEYKYVLNTSSKKIHYAYCVHVSEISPENIAYTNDYQKAINEGYTPCKTCNPK